MSEQLQIPPELMQRYVQEAERKERIAACQAELAELLKRYGCALEPQLTMVNRGYQLNVLIVSAS